METQINSWLHWKNVREISFVWDGRPTGLGYYDIALYYLLGQKLEDSASQKGAETTARILNMGTYFGHSAFCFAYGSSKVRKNPILEVLSIDIFEQPQWLLSHVPAVVKFGKDFGSTGPEAIGRWLDIVTARIGLVRNSVQLMKRNVLTLSVQDIAEAAPEGFEVIAVDCAKSPELMNQIVEYLTDLRVCRIGTTVAFQDLFDWHAPWNAFALSRMVDVGILALNLAGPRITPYAEKVRQFKIGPICDAMAASPIGDDWSRPFTTLDSETAALDSLIRMFRSQGYIDFTYRLECMKVGALMRGGRMDAAQTQIIALDRQWPIMVKDSYLQNAFCRFMHLKTGKKDLSLVLDTRAHRFRNSFLARNLRYTSTRSRYLLPIRLAGTHNILDAAFSERYPTRMTT